MSIGHWFRIGLVSALVGAVVAFAAFLWLDWASPDRIEIGPVSPGTIVVLIDGAVATPGLVELVAGSRLVQAIDAAGGLTRDADVTGLNLAARLGDGEHITIPGTDVPVDHPGASGTPASPASGLIDINTATVAELDQLPGIGPALAQRIVEYREINGPFTSVDQLAEVSGISAEMVDELRPLVTIGG